MEMIHNDYAFALFSDLIVIFNGHTDRVDQYRPEHHSFEILCIDNSSDTVTQVSTKICSRKSSVCCALYGTSTQTAKYQRQDAAEKSLDLELLRKLFNRAVPLPAESGPTQPPT